MKRRPSPILREIAGVIGLEAMTKFANTFAGTRVYIPAAIGQDHPIARAIGDDAAVKLANYFVTTSLSKNHQRLSRRGQSIEIPLGLKSEKLFCESGLSARAAALKHGVTARTIHRHRARARDAGLL